MDINSLPKTLEGLKIALAGFREFASDVNANMSEFESKASKEAIEDTKAVLGKLNINNSDFGSIIAELQKIRNNA